jgi:RimJ/RimL family protein N-acetyltransferase
MPAAMMSPMPVPDAWPLRHLVLRTPRLELRPDDDAGLLELVDVAYRGVHDPAEMPFGVPWTDAPPEELGRNAMQFFWSQRTALRPDNWSIHFLIRLDGTVIGTQGIRSEDFAITREVSTGSWIGLRHQRQGIGTEMRAAVLLFAFDHLGARIARSGAFLDNFASLGVSRKLGYVPDGTATHVRRGEPATQQRLLLTRDAFVRPQWTVEVKGLTDDCRALLGLT